jgi:hypothetical protein
MPESQAFIQTARRQPGSAMDSWSSCWNRKQGEGMSTLNLTTLRCEALFASALPQSDQVAPLQVRLAIIEALRTLGARGCAEWVAQEYGDYPEAAVARMRWARFLVAHAFAVPDPATEDTGQPHSA